MQKKMGEYISVPPAFLHAVATASTHARDGGGTHQRSVTREDDTAAIAVRAALTTGCPPSARQMTDWFQMALRNRLAAVASVLAAWLQCARGPRTTAAAALTVLAWNACDRTRAHASEHKIHHGDGFAGVGVLPAQICAARQVLTARLAAADATPTCVPSLLADVLPLPVLVAAIAALLVGRYAPLGADVCMVDWTALLSALHTRAHAAGTPALAHAPYALLRCLLVNMPPPRLRGVSNPIPPAAFVHAATLVAPRAAAACLRAACDAAVAAAAHRWCGAVQGGFVTTVRPWDRKAANALAAVAAAGVVTMQTSSLVTALRAVVTLLCGGRCVPATTWVPALAAASRAHTWQRRRVAVLLWVRVHQFA